MRQAVAQFGKRCSISSFPVERLRCEGLLEQEASPNAVGDKRLRHLPRNSMDRLPSGAVSRDNHGRTEFFEGGHCQRDNSLKERSREMKSADHGVDLLDSCQLLGVANGIDDPRMPAAREDNESFVLDM